jgi:hypothetical protein
MTETLKCVAFEKTKFLYSLRVRDLCELERERREATVCNINLLH